MNVFISGGCKNGKSFYAQRLARRQADETGSPLYYIATMIPHDEGGSRADPQTPDRTDAGDHEPGMREKPAGAPG